MYAKKELFRKHVFIFLYIFTYHDLSVGIGGKLCVCSIGLAVHDIRYIEKLKSLLRGKTYFPVEVVFCAQVAQKDIYLLLPETVVYVSDCFFNR